MKRRLPLRLTLPLVILIAMAGVTGGLNALRSGRNHPFDSRLWRGETAPPSDWPNDPPLRQQIVGDLIRRELAVGKTEGDVEALLGKPDLRRPDHWEYTLGLSSSRMGIESLVVTFGPDGRSQQATLHTQAIDGSP